MNFLDKLLNHFNLTYEEYLSLSKNVDEISLINPNSIKGMDKVKERIFKAIENKEKILVYGDYDCDGICATTIMVRTFQKLGYNVDYYIPSRYSDGYGLNVEQVNIACLRDTNLIITVDNGISAHEAIDVAVNNGVDVIVIDHHELPPEPVKAVGIIHPTYSDISDIIGSGGYMALFVSSALLGHYDDYLVTLAGLSTISDLMELKGYNRDVVRLALDNLKKHRYPTLCFLMDSNVITEKTFSLEIAPKINAVGRVYLSSSKVAVNFLLSTTNDDIFRFGQKILDYNEERKQLTKEAFETVKVNEEEAAICLLTDMKEGLIGLLANRLMNEYNRPCIIFTPEQFNDSILKGSIRSKEGFNVTKAFETLNKYLLTGGGHALAGGLSIKREDFEDFKRDFLKLAKEYPIIEPKEETIDISLNDISLQNYEILQTFMPFGMSFKEPSFKISNLPTQGLTFISFGKHLSHKLTMNTKLLGFNMNESEIKSKRSIDIIGNFNLSEYKGYQTLEFRINKYN